MTTLEQLRSPHVEECLAAIREVAARVTVGADELEALGECLGQPRKAVQRRAAEACAALHARGIPVRPVLFTALRSEDGRRRWGAAFALSLIGSPPAECLPVLLEALGTDDGDTRWAAADILVRMKGDPQLIGALCMALRAGAAAQRKMALYCLRDVEARSPEVERAMFEALDDEDVGVLLAAMSSLTRLSSDRRAVAQHLLRFLTCDDERLRRTAAATLGPLKERSEPVINALRAAAASSDASLRRAAERSLRLLVE